MYLEGLKVSRTLETRKAMGLQMSQNFSLRFCVFKWASSLFTGIVFKFHIHVHNLRKKKTNLQSKGPFNYFPVILRSLRTNENDNLYCGTETWMQNLLHRDLFLRSTWWKSNARDIVFTISATLAYFGDFFRKKSRVSPFQCILIFC